MKLVRAGVALCLGWMLIEAALTLREWRGALARVEHQIDLVRQDLYAAILEAEIRAERQIAAARGSLIAEVETTRAELLARVDAAGSRMDARAAEIQQEAAVVMSRATETASSAASLLDEARPGVRAWSLLSPALAANTLGAIAAAKVTAGETAQMMREIQRATPSMVASIQASTVASQQAAQSAAQTAANLATITRPGPRWLRTLGIAATVAVPASQVALPFTLLAK